MIRDLRKKIEIMRGSENLLWKILIYSKDIAWWIKDRTKAILTKVRDKRENKRIAQELYDENSLGGLSLWGYANFRHYLDSEEKLKIPDRIRNIKLDIGMSHSAPNSQIWLKKFDDRIVFGFEPNRENARKLMASEILRPYLNNRFFVYALAIDDGDPQIKTFYMTKEDSGTSSLYSPTRFALKKVSKVPTIPLCDFLDLIPWSRFPYIEHMKIDTQGNDLRVIKSAGKYLQERIVFVTAECSTDGQYEYSHTEEELDSFMKANSFIFVQGSKKGEDKTYLNKRFAEISKGLDHSTV